MWPALSVRSWQGVLERREPDYYELYGYGPDLDDDVLGAEYAQRIHELRGLVMAQVAEIEDLHGTFVSDGRSPQTRLPQGFPD